ncbi:MAG: Grx4 family monothiol glutaredoxin [FCB group bacterium]|nr:Grx4 family monothiol glutaredoxin [FCB group bacterium]
MQDAMKSTVEKAINSNRVFLMLKGTPQSPRCGFSARVVKILSEHSADYSYFNVFDDPELMDKIKEYSNWPTTPQLYVEGKLIGGCDIVEQLHESGSLSAILNQENPTAKSC